jgi:N-acetylglucosaminyl-diphospho-decaprenol L-rhamnosyltransferase
MGLVLLEDNRQGRTNIADVAVLIVAYRSRETIGRCLDALAAQTVKPKEVFVVENGSGTGERLRACDIPEGVVFLENDDNRGFAAANNQLAQLATTRWLALLNPDAFAAPDWLEQLSEAIDRYQDVSVFGSTQIDAANTQLLDGCGDEYHLLGLARRGGSGSLVSGVVDDQEAFSACGAAMLVRKSVFLALGGFDERYFCYFEDIDFSFRYRLLGGKVMQIREAVVHHIGSASTGELSDFAVYHGVRNRMWTFVKDMPGLWMWLLLLPHLAVTAFEFLGTFKRGVIKPYARGYLRGLMGIPRSLADRKFVQRERRVRPGMLLSKMTKWRF